MPIFLWILVSLIAYVSGLVLVTLVTPRLLTHPFDEGLLMGVAALDVLGGMLAFGAVAITFGIFGGSFTVKVLDFFLLLGILIVSIRMAYRSFRPRKLRDTSKVSRILSGSYCLLLLVAALYCMVLLFVTAQ